MGREFLRFARNPQLLQPRVDVGSKRREVRRSFHARPKNARALRVREKPQPAESQLNQLVEATFLKSGANRIHLAGVNMADKFQSDAQVLRAHPARTIF